MSDLLINPEGYYFATITSVDILHNPTRGPRLSIGWSIEDKGKVFQFFALDKPADLKYMQYSLGRLLSGKDLGYLIHLVKFKAIKELRDTLEGKNAMVLVKVVHYADHDSNFIRDVVPVP